MQCTKVVLKAKVKFTVRSQKLDRVSVIIQNLCEVKLWCDAKCSSQNLIVFIYLFIYFCYCQGPNPGQWSRIRVSGQSVNLK